MAIRKRSHCAYCGTRLPPDARRNQKYCDARCKRAAAYQRRKARKVSDFPEKSG